LTDDVSGRAIARRRRTFHALTRSRRSCRDYPGLPLRRDEFDALLYSACGVTGAMPWAGREVKLRSQNLILAATAPGLSARPFGGVLDDLLNDDLGLDGAEEQVLLSVLVGHTGGRQGV
jgi:nitroreductase